MNKPVNFEIAKLLKEKGFSWECRHFYCKSKYDKEFYLTTGIEYESDKDCVWDWNLNGGKSGMLSKKIPYPNDDNAIYYSAPTIAEVVMWLYEKHGIWTVVNVNIMGSWYFEHFDLKEKRNAEFKPTDTHHDSPTEAYEAAIEYTLKNLL